MISGRGSAIQPGLRRSMRANMTSESAVGADSEPMRMATQSNCLPGEWPILAAKIS
ncbi:MAG: hypothetical protein QOC94_2346 [Actinoplanes sp.]|jgi:hypothetical protein|nr:hypothetical protein [Actinoplanes sp.]